MAVGDRVACITVGARGVKGDAWSGRPRLVQAAAPRSPAAFQTRCAGCRACDVWLFVLFVKPYSYRAVFLPYQLIFRRTGFAVRTGTAHPHARRHTLANAVAACAASEAAAAAVPPTEHPPPLLPSLPSPPSRARQQENLRKPETAAVTPPNSVARAA